MKLFTNIGMDNYGEYFVFNKKEAYENYKAEKSGIIFGNNLEDDENYKNFETYLNQFIELDKNLQGEYTTNVRNNVCRVTVKIDNKKNRNLIDYEEEII
jgi:hypothetical protein